MPQKKIALINDITGFGRCSVAVMAPVISAMKIQAVAVPTAILSTHTQFPKYFFDDYTSKMRDYIQTYKDLDMSFDAIATGFLGSEEQVDIVIDFIRTFKKKGVFTLVDPVMGDYGRLYTTYTPELCEKMRALVHYADILTPNLTELCSLTGSDYRDGKLTRFRLPRRETHSRRNREHVQDACRTGPRTHRGDGNSLQQQADHELRVQQGRRG